MLDGFAVVVALCMIEILNVVGLNFKAYSHKEIKTKAGISINKACRLCFSSRCPLLKKSPKSYYKIKQKAIFIIFDFYI